MNRKIWFVFTCFALLVSGYIVVQYFIMDGFQTGLVKAKLMFGSKLSEFWYSMLFTHITTSIVALVIGPFTLSTKFRERNINRHRIMGRIYMVGILLGGLSGLYLSFYATGGLVAKLGFGLLSVFWLTSAYQALHRVKNKNERPSKLDDQKLLFNLCSSYITNLATVIYRSIWNRAV